MKKIAIITARGGSKRIPRKNIKPFLGKPIIAYSIEEALKSNLFDKVMVSTDDDEIAAIATKYGAEVPFKRSKKNADDHASTIDVILEVLQEYAKEGLKFDYGCCIYPTAPFINKKLLDDTFELLLENNYDSTFPIIKFSFPIQRALKIDEDSKIIPFHPEHINTRSQDLELAYHDAGQFYWFNVKSILDKKKLWTENSGGIIISEMDAQDIDYQEDWEVAEFKYKMKND